MSNSLAVIFDFDGVILHSEPVHEAAVRDALRALGVEPAWTDWSRYVGLGDRDAFARILADHARPFDEPTYVAMRDAKLRSISARLARGDAPAIPGSVELLRAAAARWPVGVCSGSRLAEVEPPLVRLGVRTLLRALTTADDVARTKPDPEGYARTARLLGVPPQRCVAIEDTPTGTTAAVRAGCVCVCVATTAPAGALLEAGAVHVAPTMADLTLELLERAASSAHASR